MPPARRHAVQIKPNRMSGFHPLTCCGLTPALTAHVCTQGQGRRRARLLWGKRVNSKRLGKGCGKSREREAWGAGPYKAPPNTSQALSCSSVPRFRTSQETLSSPPAPPFTHSLIITDRTFLLSHTVPAARWVRPDRMASPRWRMNGLWRRMAGALLLCALLLSSEYFYNHCWREKSFAALIECKVSL